MSFNDGSTCRIYQWQILNCHVMLPVGVTKASLPLIGNHVSVTESNHICMSPPFDIFYCKVLLRFPFLINMISIWYEHLSEELPPLLWTNHSSCTVHHPRLETNNNLDHFTISPFHHENQNCHWDHDMPSPLSFIEQVFHTICHHWNWWPAWNSNRGLVPWKRLQFKQTLSFTLMLV